MTRNVTNSHCRGPDPCPDPNKSKPRPVVTGVKWLSTFNPMESSNASPEIPLPEKALQKNRSIFGLKNQSCYRRKGWPPRDAHSNLVKLWYKSFQNDQRGQIEMKNPTILSNKTSTAGSCADNQILENKKSPEYDFKYLY